MSHFQKRWNQLAATLLFREIEEKYSEKRDIHALCLLDRVFPGTENLIEGSEANQIWFSIPLEKLETLSDQQIRELDATGVFYDEEFKCLSMVIEQIGRELEK